MEVETNDKQLEQFRQLEAQMGAKLQDAIARKTYEYMGLGSVLTPPTSNEIKFNRSANTKEHSLADNQTYYYEVTIIDSRVEDDSTAAEFFGVRADGDEEARLRAFARSEFDENDYRFLDIVAKRQAAVKAYTED